MISAVGLSKKYMVYRNVFSRFKDWCTPSSFRFHEDFWALRDTSFSVRGGESLGIIGMNGAGKSTLLRILSGVTKPTTGSFQLGGTATSLLDLGIGFHPELTGRENIMLHAELLGISGPGLNEQVERILDFAELGDFADRPIKTYSSGMFVRFGFSSAVCVDPDILIIDEVLAVGDAYFQKKTTELLLSLKDRGKTFVIASHALPVIERMCEHCIWLHEGEIRSYGKSGEVIEAYEEFSNQMEDNRLLRKGREQAVSHEGTESRDDSAERPLQRIPGQRRGKGPIKITKVEMYGEKDKATWVVTAGYPLRIRLDYSLSARAEKPSFALAFHDFDGTVIFWTSSFGGTDVDFDALSDEGHVEYSTPEINLGKGTYFLTVLAYEARNHGVWDNYSDIHYQMYELKVTSAAGETGYVHMKSTWRAG